VFLQESAQQRSLEGPVQALDDELVQLVEPEGRMRVFEQDPFGAFDDQVHGASFDDGPMRSADVQGKLALNRGRLHGAAGRLLGRDPGRVGTLALRTLAHPD
jgi:hypothetical protein